MGPLQKVYAKFQELNPVEDSPLTRVRAPRREWVSAESIHLIDSHTALRHHLNHNSY